MKELKIFVAGSKELSSERNLFKIVANDLQTEFGVSGRKGVHVEVRTFENFDYFFGEHLKGAQQAYNEYIANDADAVFFVFDDKVGGVTREEFNVAYDAFRADGRPRMCVFSKLHTGKSNESLDELRQLCSTVGQYYTDYTDYTDLRNKIERSIRQLCNALITGSLPTHSRRRKKFNVTDDPKDSPKSRRRWWLWVLIATVVVAIGVGLFCRIDEQYESAGVESAYGTEDFAQQRRADSLAHVVEVERYRSDSLARVAQRLESEKNDRAKQERIAKEKAEAERKAAEKAEQDRLTQEKVEQERVAQEQKTKDYAEPKTTEKTYTIGDFYDDGTKRGVVFQVWDSGRHGKIVSLDQTKLQWCTKAQYNKNIVVGAVSNRDGKANTDKVMARSDAAEYPAFAWCRNKGKDWYLPAKNELELLLLNDSVHNTVNSTLSRNGATPLFNKGDVRWYWTSTETYELCAWLVDVANSTINGSCKDNNDYVRAVSVF